MPKPYIPIIYVPKRLEERVECLRSICSKNPFCCSLYSCSIYSDVKKPHLSLSQTDNYDVFIPAKLGSIDKVKDLKYYPELEAGGYSKGVQVIFDSIGYHICRFIEEVSAFISNICLDTDPSYSKLIMDIVLNQTAFIDDRVDHFLHWQEYENLAEKARCLKILKYKEYRYSFMVLAIAGLFNIKIKPEFRALFSDRNYIAPSPVCKTQSNLGEISQCSIPSRV
jgi:hypothetical protein